MVKIKKISKQKSKTKLFIIRIQNRNGILESAPAENVSCIEPARADCRRFGFKLCQPTWHTLLRARCKYRWDQEKTITAHWAHSYFKILYFEVEITTGIKLSLICKFLLDFSDMVPTCYIQSKSLLI